MIVELDSWAVAVANITWWAAVHTATGYFVHRLPASRLASDGPLLRIRRWERQGRTYERLRIRRWKDRLPEAGALLPGGLTKRHLPSPGRAGLERFAVETRRAEICHWLAMAGGPVAALWNPPLGTTLMVAYGVAVNAPFVVVQRYNRARIARMTVRVARS